MEICSFDMKELLFNSLPICRYEECVKLSSEKHEKECWV